MPFMVGSTTKNHSLPEKEWPLTFQRRFSAESQKPADPSKADGFLGEKSRQQTTYSDIQSERPLQSMMVTSLPPTEPSHDAIYCMHITFFAHE
jgi:hypothetical protein